ncbi:MAG TPA: fructose-bisphosphatase class II, partial [Candidatus Polarisedimenticolia bacterium]|nr:fructose-bisphosphatase class II [Candidatus Polarisedimenticolia bacterium]
GVTVADPLDRIVEAVMDTRGTHEINIFALDRPRHPIEQMMALGANMRIDTDGDAYPVAAAGLSWGVFPDNLRPLDGVCGNIGGAAEMLASAAGGHYLGVRTTARFCARKIRSWEERYGFAPGEEDALKAAGFDPARVYRIEELIPGLTKSDGVLVAAAITDNWHVPGMDACWIGGNYAAVTALFIGSAGTADLYRVVFTYPAGLDATAEALTPIVTRLLGLPAGDIPAAVLAALADPASARRLRNELGTSFYSHLRPGGKTAAASTRLALDIESAAKVESASATALLRAVMRAAPDWFE